MIHLSEMLHISVSNIYSIMLYVNAFVCACIAIRLISYQREGATFKLVASVVAYCLIVAFGSIPIRVLFHDYLTVDYSELVINIILLGIVFRARGNVMHLFRRSNLTTEGKSE